MLNDSELPSIDLSVPLPENILRQARANPLRSIGLILSQDSASASPAIVDVTWHHALHGVRRRAAELVAATGCPPRNLGEEPFVVGLLLRNGYSCFLTLTATIMLRWTPIVLSPRNSASGTIHLMKSAHSSHLIVDPDLLSFAESLNELTFQIVSTTDASSYDDEDNNTENIWADYPTAQPEALSREATDGVLTYMHTSGSTGHPKLVPWTHRWVSTVLSVIRRQRPLSIGCTFYTIMPLFHSIGVLFTYLFTAGLAGRVHFLNPRQPPTVEVVLRHLALHDDSKSLEILLPPSILEIIVGAHVEGLKSLKRATIVMTSGALLRREAGDFLRSFGVPVQQIVGMTETAPLAMMTVLDDPSDWEYMALTDMYDFYFKDADGKAKEMIVLRKENTPCVINHRDPEGFATGDLYEQHPDKPHLWKIVGRVDDITVLSNGEKTNNKQLELLLRASPLIDNAAIFGVGRFFNGAIISPSTPLASYTPTSVSSYLDTVWPHITEHVNSIVPQHS